MKNKIVNGVLVGGLSIFLFACNSKKEETVAASAVDVEQIKKEIQAKEDEFANLYNTGQMKNIGYYADDATAFFQHRPPLIGKEAILEFLKVGLDSNTNKLTFTTKDIFPSNDGNQVVEVGYFKLTDSANNIINSGNYMILFEKRNGKYVSVREMSTSDMPLN